MDTISRENYYMALAYYLIACEAQREVRKYETLLSEIFKDAKLNDMIYDPLTKGTKKEYDQFLSGSSIMIEWQKPLNLNVGDK